MLYTIVMDKCTVCKAVLLNEDFRRCAGVCGLDLHTKCASSDTSRGEMCPACATWLGGSVSPSARKAVSPTRELILPEIPTAESIQVQLETIRLNGSTTNAALVKVYDLVLNMACDMAKLTKANKDLSLKLDFIINTKIDNCAENLTQKLLAMDQDSNDMSEPASSPSSVASVIEAEDEASGANSAEAKLKVVNQFAEACMETTESVLKQSGITNFEDVWLNTCKKTVRDPRYNLINTPYHLEAEIKMNKKKITVTPLVLEKKKLLNLNLNWIPLKMHQGRFLVLRRECDVRALLLQINKPRPLQLRVRVPQPRPQMRVPLQTSQRRPHVM